MTSGAPPIAREEYLYWQKADKATLNWLNRLLNEVLGDPAAGIGKPEPLRPVLAGCWSRRIDEEHRLVHLLDGDDIVVLQARSHYEP